MQGRVHQTAGNTWTKVWGPGCLGTRGVENPHSQPGPWAGRSPLGSGGSVRACPGPHIRALSPSRSLSSVQPLSCVRLSATPWTATCHASMSCDHQLPELAQTHVLRVGDAIQPSHPLLSPSSPAFNLSEHQGPFQCSQFFASGGQRTGASASASVLTMNIQD